MGSDLHSPEPEGSGTPRVVAERYEIVRKLGSGGMGEVSEAHDRTTGAGVALKLLHTNDRDLVRRFQREARAASRLDTPHIVRVLDFGTDPAGDTPFMVMELLEGEDLQHLIARLGCLPPDLCLRVASQVCRGLVAAHAEQITHRDIKPANLFLTRAPGGRRVVKILDFGIAKIHGSIGTAAEGGKVSAAVTRTGSMVGSPMYMAPEQARGHKDVDHRADLWALGIVLYQALTGRTPHEDTEALGDLIVTICTEPPPPVQHEAPWVGPEVARLVRRALQLARSERFQSAAEMLAAVDLCLPDGDAITDDMLAAHEEGGRGPLRGPGRSVVRTAKEGRAFDTNSPPTRVERSGASPAVFESADGPEPVASARTAPSAKALAASETTLHTPTLRPAGRGWWLGLAIVGMLLVGIAVWLATRGGPAGVAAASATPPAGTAPTVDRVVRLVVLPDSARVEVAGRAAAVHEGIVELTGPVGSVVRVRVFEGDRERVVDVAISEGGPVPAKIELASVASSASAAPSTSSSVSPAALPPVATTSRAPAPAATPTSDWRTTR